MYLFEGAHYLTHILLKKVSLISDAQPHYPFPSLFVVIALAKCDPMLENSVL